MTLQRIDCQALGGVAGDMFAAALFDAFPELYKDFCSDLDLLKIDGLSAELSIRTSHSLRAQHFTVSQNTTVKPPRTLPAVKEFLDSKSLNTEVVDTAVGIYHLLAIAEAAVHGKTVDTVHFHEVSDWDSMIDILAAAGLIVRIKCPQWRIGPLPLGGGTIKTAHGDIPLPAPATVSMLQGYEWIDDGQPGERLTPTGAAIVAYLSPDRLHETTAPAGLAAVGVGCGTRKLADRANIFRVCAFAATEADAMQRDVVSRLSFEVDDMTGEEIAHALDILREMSGVVDVSTVAMHGKKGRPSTGFRILVLPEVSSKVVDACFCQTTTLGVRHHEVQRSILQRSHKQVDNYQIKTAIRPEGVVTAKMESDDLNKTQTLQARRTLARQVEQKATDD